MLLVDANVLIHAVNAGSHGAARNRLRQALLGSEAVAFAWTVTLAFLRLSTQPAVFPRRLTVARRATAIERWLEASPAVTIEPTRQHLPLLRGLSNAPELPATWSATRIWQRWHSSTAQPSSRSTGTSPASRA